MTKTQTPNKLVRIETGPTFTGRGSNRRVFDHFVRETHIDTTGRKFRGERAVVTRFDSSIDALVAAAIVIAKAFADGSISEDEFIAMSMDIDVTPNTAMSLLALAN